MRSNLVLFASGCGLLAVSLLSTQGATAPAAPTGYISAKGYLNIGGGTTIPDLTNNPKFPASPDVAYYYPYFEWNADPNGDINTPANNAYAENYGAQLAGYFYPPVNGDYVFLLASDDAGNLYLSTDSDPANKKLIAQEAGWSNPRSWDTIGGGSTVEAKNSSSFTGTQWPTKDSASGGAKITLQASKPYYIEALMKEGGGGDNLAVAVQAPNGSIDPSLPIPGKYLAPFAVTTTAAILSQPKDAAVYAGSSANFSVGLDLPPGTTLTSVKWQKNGVDIAGATSTSVTIPVTEADNNAKVKSIITTSSGTLTSSEATISVATISNEFTQGVVKFEAFTDISGTAISGLTDSDKYTGNKPDDVRLLTGIDTPNGYGDNYGARVTGFIIPTESGDYTFFLRSDDASQLWLSTDDNPANAKLIAEETGCCSAFLEPNPDQGAAWHDNGQGMGQTTLTPITLTAGKKYAFYALVKEGGGGDYLQVAVRKAGNTTAAGSLRPLSGSWVGANAKPNLGEPQITRQPVLPPTMIEGQPWSISIDGTVTPAGFNYPLLVQWQKNGTNILGATDKTYTIKSVTKADAGTYRAVASAPSGKSVTSTELIATVMADTAPPTIVSAQKSFQTDTKVVVVFSEAVAASTANAAANYKVNNGITVSGATLTSNPRVVELTTSAIAKGSTNQLTVSGVQDLFGNTIAANASVTIGLQKNIFFVTADAGPLTFAGDIAVQQHLLERGFDVTLALGSDVPDNGSTAQGSDLIIESSSLASSTVEVDGVGKFRTLAVPALEWEASSTDAFAFQEANPVVGTLDNLTQVNIVDPTSPLAAGFPAGPVTVMNAPATFSQSTPTGAHVVATQVPDPSQSIIYYYEKGDKGFNGFVMPARRVFFFFQDNTAASANENGWKLFDAAVDWLLGIQSTTNPPPTGQGNLSVSRTPNGLTISWSGAGTLQSTPSLASPITWIDESGTSPVTVTPAGTAKFYRLK